MTVGGEHTQGDRGHPPSRLLQKASRVALPVTAPGAAGLRRVLVTRSARPSSPTLVTSTSTTCQSGTLRGHAGRGSRCGVVTPGRWRGLTVARHPPGVGHQAGADAVETESGGGHGGGCHGVDVVGGEGTEGTQGTLVKDRARPLCHRRRQPLPQPPFQAEALRGLRHRHLQRLGLGTHARTSSPIPHPPGALPQNAGVVPSVGCCPRTQVLSPNPDVVPNPRWCPQIQMWSPSPATVPNLGRCPQNQMWAPCPPPPKPGCGPQSRHCLTPWCP